MPQSVSFKQADRAYVIESAVIAILYVGVLWYRPYLVAQSGGGALATAITLLPILPMWLLFWAALRYYRRIDEYKKQRFLEVLSLSFGIGACVIVSYGFLTDVGLPKLGFYWAWPILGVTWALVSLVHEFVTCR
jgi:hypothetical protein